MANFIISLGKINKKLLYPLCYVIVYICVNIFYEYYDYDGVTMYLEHFGYSIGEMMTYILVYAFKYQSASDKIKNKRLKDTFKDYFILFLINCFYMVDYVLPYYIFREDESGEEEEENYDNKVEDLFIADGFQIIFITISTLLILKYKYYIHHIISTAIFFILCIFIDILAGNFKYINTPNIINSIMYIFSDAIIYAYYKYLIDKKYYYFMDVLFYQGLFDSIVHLTSISIIIFVQYMNGTNQLIFEFFYMYDEYGSSYMVLWSMMGFVLIGLLVGYLEFSIVNELTPNYVPLGYCLGRIPTTIMAIDGYKKWIILILFLLLIFISLFYLEILEYNFCSLNVNTRKNIRERERNQIFEGIEEEERDSYVIIKGYDMTDVIKTKTNFDESIEEEIN